MEYVLAGGRHGLEPQVGMVWRVDELTNELMPSAGVDRIKDYVKQNS